MRYFATVLLAATATATLAACGGPAPQAMIPLEDIKVAYAQVTVCPIGFAPALQLSNDGKKILDPDCAKVNLEKGEISGAPFLAGSQKQYGVVFFKQPDGRFVQKVGSYFDSNDIEPIGDSSRASDKVNNLVIKGFAQENVRLTSQDADDYKKITGNNYVYGIVPAAQVEIYEKGLVKMFKDRYQYDLTKPLSQTNQPIQNQTRTGNRQSNNSGNGQYGNNGNRQQTNGQGQIGNGSQRGGNQSLPLFESKFPNMQLRKEGRMYIIFKADRTPADTKDYKIQNAKTWDGVILQGYNASRSQQGNDEIIVFTRKSR
jgi:hypothetical protein